jgi:predicted RNA binding protein YcfA (HicA-like mRNA interferase family)
MGKYDKILIQVMSGTADANIGFDELCQLLTRLGFESRVRGSHHIFFKQNVVERINLQCDGNKAKPYQVRQIRKIIFENGLGV